MLYVLSGILLLFIQWNRLDALACISDVNCSVFDICAANGMCIPDMKNCPNGCAPGHVCIEHCVPNPLYPQPKSCAAGWKKFGDTNNCYMARFGWFNYPSAREECKGLNAILTSVHSNAEMDFINELAHGQMIWLGIKKNGNFANSLWDDGTNFDFSNFRNGEPDGCCDGGRCIIANYKYGNGQWDDAGCGQRWKPANVAVCKKAI